MKWKRQYLFRITIKKLKKLKKEWIENMQK